MDLSLSRLHKLIPYLPPYNIPTVHITGTNGKGSVSAIVASILRSSSLLVGQFSSPHLLSPNDAILVNGKPVSEHMYQSCVAQIRALDDQHKSKLTSFEIQTLTALLAFITSKCDVVVMEVGMGGRRDATNIIPDIAVLCSAITSVGLDHQAFLGTTVGEIAREKSGIARKGRPFILGTQDASEEGQIVLRAVSEVVVEGAGGDLVHSIVVQDVDEGKAPSSGDDHLGTARKVKTSLVPNTVLQFPLHGAHQLLNLSTALTIIDSIRSHPSCISRAPWSHLLTTSSIAEGVKSTKWPGRLSYHSINCGILHHPPSEDTSSIDILVDGAHNAPSARALGSYISTLPHYKSHALTFILALSHSPPKTPLQTLSALFEALDHLSRCISIRIAFLGFTPPEGMPWVHAEDPAELATVIRNNLSSSLAESTGAEPEIATFFDMPSTVAGLDVIPETRTPLERALSWAIQGDKVIVGGKHTATEGGLIVLAGSLYLVADFYRFLQNRTGSRVWEA